MKKFGSHRALRAFSLRASRARISTILTKIHYYHKGIVFFLFLRKSMCSLTHTNLEHLYFFQKEGNKIQLYFSFSQEKFTFHSLKFSGGAYLKKTGKAIFFLNALFNPILRCIFFAGICIFFPCIFFFL